LRPPLCFEGDLKEKGLKRVQPGDFKRRRRFEGDLKEKGLKRCCVTIIMRFISFEGDLKEKGLKRQAPTYRNADTVLKET